ncbi:putative uncharacterized protein [Clostridium sp. CAG:167]|nr:putative uncharacterized protein [Clostridium sp. CAG:167]
MTKKEQRIKKLTEYLQRLGAGEELEEVRKDFIKEFSDVQASEIMEAEQELMKQGTPLEEVQRLCDVHAALFHGVTPEEEMKKRQSFEQKEYGNKSQQAQELEQVEGHPLYTLTKENQALLKLLQQFAGSEDENLLSIIGQFAVHYAKKGDLLYPHLKVKYGIAGPSDVMWTVDDEIRDEYSALMRESQRGDEWNKRLRAVLKRIEEMVHKEQNILFQICAVNFTKEEWMGIYRDAKDYIVCFGVEDVHWQEAEDQEIVRENSGKDEIVLPGGHMTLEQLTALLNTVPLEITFIDVDNINRFFNEGPKVFKRPGMALDREVFSCHPPKIEPMVRAIIDDFRHGRKDRVPVWMEKGGRTMLVTYMAVRDKTGKYVGTAEFVQDMEFAKEHFGKK